MRNKTWVVIEEAKSGDWGIGGTMATAEDIRRLRTMATAEDIRRLRDSG